MSQLTQARSFFAVAIHLDATYYPGVSELKTSSGRKNGNKKTGSELAATKCLSLGLGEEIG